MLFWAVRTALIVISVSGAMVLALAPGGPVSRMLARGAGEPATAAPTARPAHAAAIVPNELVYRRARDGHFYVEGDVNGARIRFMVDTGASLVVLSPEDARAAGIRPTDADFRGRSTTANGVARFAPVILRQFELNQLYLTDVRAAVIEQPMPASLLGMSFLSRLQGYETRGDELVLRW